MADRQRDVLAAVAELEVEEARLFARRMDLRAEMDELWNGTDSQGNEQFGVLELAGTARIGQARAATQLIQGSRLRHELPRTRELLHTGRMHSQTALLLLELTRNCSDRVTAEVERRVLPAVAELNTTDARRVIAQVIPQVEAELDPVLTQQRLDAAHERRGVWMSERPDAMVTVGAELDPLEGRRWSLDFEELVRAQRVADRRAGTERTAHERRALVFAQLPSRVIVLLRAIQRGEIGELLALARLDPDSAERLEALARELPTDEPDLLSEICETRTDQAPSSSRKPFRDVPPFGDSDPPEEPWLVPPPAAPVPEEPHWTNRAWRELAVALLALPVKDPKLLNVHVPMTTLLEIDERPATVDSAGVGGCVLPAVWSRALVFELPMRRVLVDARTEVPLGIDPLVMPPVSSTTGPLERLALLQLHEDLARPYFLSHHTQKPHDPSPVLRELLMLRDQRCTGIGCSSPAHRNHQDHEIAWPQGPTAEWNLSGKSSRCHRAKHAGWAVVRHESGDKAGWITWSSPLGHSYDRPAAWARVDLLS